MMAEMSGRLTHAYVNKGTGALESARIESSNGDIFIIKPDSWQDAEAWQAALGQPVEVRVVVTVPLVRHDR